MGTALLLNEIYPHMKFQVDRSYTLGVIVRTKIKYENQPRAMNSKKYKFQSYGSCALYSLLNEIYPHMKFQVDSSYSLRVTVQTQIKYENQPRAITQKV